MRSLPQTESWEEKERFVSAPLCNTIRQEAPVCLLLSQEDVLEQVSPTAGALTGEIAEGGGRRDGNNT